MSIPVVQLITLPRSAISFLPRRRSPLQRLAAPVAGLWRRLTEFGRRRRDWRHLEQMTSRELKDIGLHRAGPGQFILTDGLERD
jgi:uncharacterized protein YjiS (DUF1127 family)